MVGFQRRTAFRKLIFFHLNKGFPMLDFVPVAKVGSIVEGEGESFLIGEQMVAVFLHEGEYFAINDLCPHMGASLGAGCLDEEGAVTCPWHAWRFDVRDGAWRDNPTLRTDVYDVRVEGDEIQVRLGEPHPS